MSHAPPGGAYHFPPRMQQLASTAGLNVHGGPPPGPPSMMHYHHRPHSRKYDSEPLAGGAHGHTGAMRSLGGGINNERFASLHSPSQGGAPSHSASYLSTSVSSQASSRSQSRTSSLSSHSHLPSPRSHSPHSSQSQGHGHGHGHAHGHYPSPSTPSSNAQPQQHQQVQQMMSTPNGAISPPVSSRPNHLPSAALLAPQSSSAQSGGSASGSSSSVASPAAPSSSASSCSSCNSVALENVALRASLAHQQLELRLVQSACRNELHKMRSDVTKALVAFESRLHLQLQQQLGFKPDLEPMRINGGGAQSGAGGAGGSGGSIVAQALTQIQQTLDKFDPTRQMQQQQQQSDDSAWQARRSSWTASLSSGSGPSSAATPSNHNSQAILGWPDQQQGNGQASGHGSYGPGASPPQLTSSLLSSSSSHSGAPAGNNAAALNPLLANLNLGNLAQLLSAVSGIQNQMVSTSGQHTHGHQSPSPSMMHHHGNNSGGNGGQGGHHSHPNGSMTEERLILLAIDILSVHGAVPVGKMGSLLHKAACDHTLPTLLKERYGGLKKFLQSQTHFFTLGTDHPYNPSLSLSAEFLAANPHIRPPEPAAPMGANNGAPMSSSPGPGSAGAPVDALPGVAPSPPSTSNSSSPSVSSQPALPAVLDYHRYFGATTGTGSVSAAPSLLSPLSGLPRGVSAPALGMSGGGGVSDADREHSLNSYLFESDADLERVGHLLNLGGSSVASSSGGAVGSASASALSSLVADDEMGWDKHLHAADDIQDSTSSAAESTRGTDEPLLLQPAQNSPALGATEASATANETFFSRLLG